jgi:hypothetical protein
MKTHAARLKTYDSWPLCFMDKNDMAAPVFTSLASGTWFDARSVECRLGTGSLEMIPSLTIKSGALIATSPMQTFLTILTPRKVWLWL